jgi:outer membrane protein assembly factor BamB
MAYPDSRADRRHYLACFDLRTGHEYWKQPIEGEVITAPVLAGGSVYFATLGGTLYCLRQDDGRVEWQEPRNATSSPAIWEGECFFSQREEVAEGDHASSAVHQAEYLAARAMRDARYRMYKATARKADYLDHAKRVKGSPRYAASFHADSTVGFGAFKGDAKMAQAMYNLGKGHVHEIWTYQGSKPFVYRSRLYAAHGDSVTSADPRSDSIYWKSKLGAPQAEGEDLLDSPLTPPSIANGKLFFGTVHGDVHCLSAETGTSLWSVPIGEPIVFQPAVVAGRVYIGTDAGILISLETGDEADDGWQMWGADAAHNGKID